MDLVTILIKTCCALHNYVRSRDGFNIQDVLSIEGLVDVKQDNSGSSKSTYPMDSNKK